MRQRLLSDSGFPLERINQCKVIKPLHINEGVTEVKEKKRGGKGKEGGTIRHNKVKATTYHIH